MEQLSKNFSKLQVELSDLVQSRQKLETQIQENKIVKEEFNKLNDDSKIYKLIGPVLLLQDNTEANMNVDKRIEFILDEISRVETKIKNTQASMEAARDQLIQARTAAMAPLQQ
ncbi:hypothetical protein CANARDRAFT_198246 [[Candida] arabinofermentans NRRL YB-2248]|uniref:Prefoldin subunit 6 n=1 Tax=[Candida] arabinofermentans NRRL YB-2248 TaxID=983967 RepID=A0A1E4T2V6_9ASCO|nr:hypothetical protein CANARDRAFT_198246 [[Candida] arabinofermentans NRRL YB-2248]